MWLIGWIGDVSLFLELWTCPLVWSFTFFLYVQSSYECLWMSGSTSNQKHHEKPQRPPSHQGAGHPHRARQTGELRLSPWPARTTTHGPTGTVSNRLRELPWLKTRQKDFLNATETRNQYEHVLSDIANKGIYIHSILKMVFIANLVLIGSWTCSMIARQGTFFWVFRLLFFFAWANWLWPSDKIHPFNISGFCEYNVHRLSLDRKQMYLVHGTRNWHWLAAPLLPAKSQNSTSLSPGSSWKINPYTPHPTMFLQTT